MLYIFFVTWNYQTFSWYIFIKVSSYLYLIIGQPSALHTFHSESLCVYIAIKGTQNQVLQQPWLIFLQDLPHLLVCSSQVVTRFHLNICTVEVVDTGRHLTHLYLLIKVVLIMVIIPFSYHCQMRPNGFGVKIM